MAFLYEYYNTGDDGHGQVQGDVWQFQTFTPITAHIITAIKFKAYRTGNPGMTTVSIRAADANHKPTGEDLCSGITDGDTLTSDSPGEWRKVRLGNGTSLLVNTEYIIIIRALDASEPDQVKWRDKCVTPGYDRGYGGYSVDGGLTWGIWGDPFANPIDFMFEDWGRGLSFTGRNLSDFTGRDLSTVGTLRNLSDDNDEFRDLA